MTAPEPSVSRHVSLPAPRSMGVGPHRWASGQVGRWHTAEGRAPRLLVAKVLLATLVGTGLGMVGVVGTVALGTEPAVAATSTTTTSPSPTPTPAPASGFDISFPQCGGPLPSNQAFGIVGVNDGVAGTLNPCLGPDSSSGSLASSELYVARSTSVGGTRQPFTELYVNTGDPGGMYNGQPVADWPMSGTNADGTCTTENVTTAGGTNVTVGQNSPACAYQYGLAKASQDVSFVAQAATSIDALDPATAVPSNPGAYPWWLDVETANIWQPGSSGQAMNRAVLEAMVAGLEHAGVYPGNIGVYSVTSMWDAITGASSTSPGPLAGIAAWMPGAANATQAVSNCSEPSFSGGPIELAQYPGSTYDENVSCMAPYAPPTSPVVSMAPTPDGRGYYLATADGTVYTFGDAVFEGDLTGVTLNAPIVAMAIDPATGGYWLLGGDGGVFSFDAPFFGSTGNIHLNAPAVGLQATPDGNGYRFVASDGGIFDFGSATFEGSMGGQPLNKPVVGMADDAATGGYWLVAADGGIFSFDAPFYGSTGGITLNRPIIEMESLASGGGYRFVASDGGVFDFGSAQYSGSLASQTLASPVSGMASEPGGSGYWLVQADGTVTGFGGVPTFGNA